MHAQSKEMDARNSGRKEGSMKKRTVILGLAGVLLIGTGGWYVSNYGWTVPTAEMLPESIDLPWGQTIHLRQGDAESDATVYVSSVASITGDGAVGITENKCAGRNTAVKETSGRNALAFLPRCGKNKKRLSRRDPGITVFCFQREGR